jgi:tRNA(His) 5'-end guanylyltransferase
MPDSLGDRMKEYEYATRYFLPRRNYTIIRVDGKAFHTYTKGLERPFDYQLIDAMNQTAKYLFSNMMGAKLAFIQSDEISLLLTDWETVKTESWFMNNLQKMCSVSASMATGKFNSLRNTEKFAMFDSRVFQIAKQSEVINYFLWRQQDTIRNSIQSVAQSLFSHKELLGKNCSQLKEMIATKGTPWENYDPMLKFGRIVCKSLDFERIDLNREVATIKSAPLFSVDDIETNLLVPE